eukprot:223787-Amphidinium_carterae.1
MKVFFIALVTMVCTGESLRMCSPYRNSHSTPQLVEHLDKMYLTQACQAPHPQQPFLQQGPSNCVSGDMPSC